MNSIAPKRRPDLHPQERAVLAAASVQLTYVPWTYGLDKDWTQLGSLVCGVVTFIIALWPRHYTSEYTDGPNFVLVPARRLFRFPLFWIGLAFVALQLIGMFNPAYFRESNGFMWTMTPLPNIEWLPANVDVAPKLGRGWPLIAVYTSSWLLVCALWVGVTRRRSLQIVCWVLMANAFALAVVALAHRFSPVTDSELVLWTRRIVGGVPYGSFVYRNHASAYLCLMLGVALALAAWHYYEGRRRMAHSTPAGVWVIFAAVLAAAIAFSYSRGGVAIAAGFVTLAILVQVPLHFIHAGHGEHLGVKIALFGAFLIGGGLAVSWLDFSQLESRFDQFWRYGEEEASYKMRIEARGRAVEMLGDHWQRGTGAGSFEYLFHRYIRKDSYLTSNGRFYWDHAHIDWLQIPIEQGVAGSALIALAYFWCFGRFLRGAGWLHPLALMIFLASSQTLVHAYIDFPFQHPAVLMTWWSLLIIALRWIEFEPGGSKTQTGARAAA